MWNEANRPRENQYYCNKWFCLFQAQIEKGGMDMDTNKEPAKEQQYIYRPWITVNGVRIYAAAYGKKAFKIPVADK